MSPAWPGAPTGAVLAYRHGSSTGQILPGLGQLLCLSSVPRSSIAPPVTLPPELMPSWILHSDLGFSWNMASRTHVMDATMERSWVLESIRPDFKSSVPGEWGGLGSVI